VFCVDLEDEKQAGKLRSERQHVTVQLRCRNVIVFVVLSQPNRTVSTKVIGLRGGYSTFELAVPHVQVKTTNFARAASEWKTEVDNRTLDLKARTLERSHGTLIKALKKHEKVCTQESCASADAYPNLERECRLELCPPTHGR
jgi:hypothetical protein